MPLSEHEERALQEIARQLSEEDPKFVETVSNTTVARVQRRRLRLAIAGFVLGLLTLFGLIIHLAFGVVGFALMLASVVYGYQALRALSVESGDPISQLRRPSDH
jgi:hypothetical protein